MKAKVGDWLVIKGRTTERSDQRGLITEVHFADGSPPYLVRWVATDHVATVFLVLTPLSCHLRGNETAGLRPILAIGVRLRRRCCSVRVNPQRRRRRGRSVSARERAAASPLGRDRTTKAVLIGESAARCGWCSGAPGSHRRPRARAGV